MKTLDVLTQSKAAYGQWCEQWRAQAKAHSKFEMKDLRDFENSGVGRAVLCVANGYSFEENIDVIKEHQDNIDILCCDKTLGHLLDHGITPTFCMICDANVDYEKYMQKWEGKLQDTIALVNVCANPKWTEHGNWKDIYFFVNRDVIDSHVEFSQISGCNNLIPAGTNVSNAMVVMLTQSDDKGRRNFFGYDKILLIGYDYSWKHGGKYYAFNEDGDLKANYMRHLYCTNIAGEFAYTSGNLAFSCQWLEMYIKTFNLPVVQCTKSTILPAPRSGELAEQAKYRHRPEDAGIVKEKIKELRWLMKKEAAIKETLAKIDRDHWGSFLASV